MTLRILAAADIGLSPITLKSSIVDNGITFNFDKAIPTITTVTGRDIALSTEVGGFSVISTDPPSAIIGGGWANGMVENPNFRNGQGIEEYLSVGGGSFAPQPYVHADNVDPSATGVPIVIPQGTETAFIKAKRKTGKVTDALEWDTIESYGQLTVLSAQPKANIFMPTVSGPTKRIFGLDDLDYSVFRSLNLASNMGYTPAGLMAALPVDPGNFNSLGENHRRFRLEASVGLVSANYAADISPFYSAACILMHSSDFTQAEKNPLLYKMIEQGLQLDGLYDLAVNPWRGIGGIGGGAGQSGAWQPYMWLTAFALQDTTLLNKCLNVGSPFSNCYWVNAGNIDSLRPLNNGSGDIGIPFENPASLNMPFVQAEDDRGRNFEGRYNSAATGMILWEGTALALLQNGPAGVNGVSAFLNGDTGQDSFRTAAMAMATRAASLNIWPSAARDPQNGIKSVWNTDVKGLGVLPAYTQVPEELHHGSDPVVQTPFTATGRGFSFDFSNRRDALETITGQQARYSLDGVQYITVGVPTDAETVTGLLPLIEHYVGFRRQSASGWGAWTSNIQSVASAGAPAEIYKITTQQGAASVPTVPNFTVNPKIHALSEPAFGQRAGNWEEASGTLSAEQTVLACGAGYVDGDQAVTYTYEWRADGTPISGATSKTYTRTLADAGKVITCFTVPSNATGAGAGVETAGVTAPAATVLPAGTIIDTDFGPEFIVDYGEQWAAREGNNTSGRHEPFMNFAGRYQDVGGSLEGVNIGAIIGQKLGSYPSFRLPILTALEVDKTYEVLLQGVTGFDYGNNEFEAIRAGISATLQVFGATGTLVSNGGAITDHSAGPELTEVTGTFSTTGWTPTELTSLKASWYIDTAVGQSGEGDVYLTRLRIREVV